MTTTPGRLPQFITDGGIETHIIFNMGVELPHFSAFPLNDSATGREVIRSYYRDYLPVARTACPQFPFCHRQLARKSRLGRPARLRPGAAKAEQRDIGGTLRRARGRIRGRRCGECYRWHHWSPAATPGSTMPA